jgi:F-box-like
MQLPPEVYSLIVKYVGMRADLFTLCLVSQRFRTAAERELYQTLDMVEPSVTVMTCDVLAEQPRLSQLVVTLILCPDQLEEGHGDNASNPQARHSFSLVSDYWTSVSKALQKTTHLRSLRIYLNSGIPTNHAWILGGCNFQLHSFHCDLAWDSPLASFLSTQLELSDLHISDFNEDVPENTLIRTHSLRHARTLPSLSILDCTFTEAVGIFVPGRPVTHIKTCFSSSSNEARRVELALLLADLRLSTQPIRSLTVADESYTTAFSLEFLSSLVRAFGPTPQLKYVGPLVLPVDGHEVSDNGMGYPRPTAPGLTVFVYQRLVFYGKLAHLRELRSVELDISEWEPPPESFAALRGLARELHLFVPSIVTVVFVRDLEPTVLRAVDGLWQIADNIIADTMWRSV